LLFNVFVQMVPANAPRESIAKIVERIQEIYDAGGARLMVGARLADGDDDEDDEDSEDGSPLTLPMQPMRSTLGLKCWASSQLH
jgi:hypothetical protein